MADYYIEVYSVISHQSLFLASLVQAVRVSFWFLSYYMSNPKVGQTGQCT